MIKIPTTCPICGGETYIESVKCNSCHTQITNKFALSKFDKLTENQIEFVLTFLGVEGNIKEMEKALGISYPTVKSRLMEIQQLLGLNVKSKVDKQMEILEKIENKQISVEQALELLSKK